MKNVKFAYFQDLKESDRVLTLARKVAEKNEETGEMVLHVGWSLNRRPNPNVVKSHHCLDLFFDDYDFDHYDRTKGKSVAINRLKKDPLIIDVGVGERPYEKMLEVLQNHDVFYVQQIIKQHIVKKEQEVKLMRFGSIVEGSSDFYVGITD